MSVLPPSLCQGGTDIVSCFMGQNPTVPVYRGEIQTRNLGMAVEAWGHEGKSVCQCVLCACSEWMHRLENSVESQLWLNPKREKKQTKNKSLVKIC